MEVEPEPAKVAEKASSSTKPKPKRNTIPDRPPPPPQPQDGSVIVKPGGASTKPEIPKVSQEDQDKALSTAKEEIAKRKANAGNSDDPISKALKDVDQKDIDKAFGELKKAAEKYGQD